MGNFGFFILFLIFNISEISSFPFQIRNTPNLEKLKMRDLKWTLPLPSVINIIILKKFQRKELRTFYSLPSTRLSSLSIEKFMAFLFYRWTNHYKKIAIILGDGDK